MRYFALFLSIIAFFLEKDRFYMGKTSFWKVVFDPNFLSDRLPPNLAQAHVWSQICFLYLVPGLNFSSVYEVNCM